MVPVIPHERARSSGRALKDVTELALGTFRIVARGYAGLPDSAGQKLLLAKLNQPLKSIIYILVNKAGDN